MKAFLAIAILIAASGEVQAQQTKPFQVYTFGGTESCATWLRHGEHEGFKSWILGF